MYFTSFSVNRKITKVRKDDSMIRKKVTAGLAALTLTVSSMGMQFNGLTVIAEETSTESNISSSENTSIVGSADIVFVIDSTGSMEEYITSVKDNLTNFVNSLNSKGVLLNMSVVEYRDIEEDGADSTVYYDFNGSNWTNDVNEVIKVFDAIEVDGGGDTPETPIDAFEKITLPDDDATKFIFLLTDADFKDYDDTEDNHNNNHYSMDVWTNYFRSNNIKVTVVSQNEYESDYNYLYTMTGGRFIDITSDNYYELMQEYSEWIYENSVDSDGDGLPDDWEINGVDVNHDGIIDLDLAAMGADPNVPDIFIEADWMEYEGDDFNFLWIHEKRNQKNTAPTALALKKVYDQFNSHGIKVHIDAGPNSIMNYDTGETWGALSGASALSYQETFHLGSYYENWNQLAIDNFTRARWTTFRYCLFANQYDAGNGNRSSGIAENIPGQFFIVASNCIGGSNHDTALAGTIMHELGHTLGLSHGGVHTDNANGEIVNNHDNYKPNHLSIMNYSYQFSGLRTVLGDYITNYQDFELPEIDENHVNESRGIDPEGVTEGKGLTIKIPVKNRFLLWEFDGEEDSDIARQSIDFNKNGTIENDIRYDLNNDSEYRSLTATLNEWSNLKFSGGLIGGYGEDVNLDEISTLITKPDFDHELDELSIDEAFENGLLGDPGDCQFNDVNSKKLYSELTAQSLFIDVSNMYPEETTVEIKVSSDVLLSDYSATVIVSKDGANIEIPIQNSLTVGSYDAVYTLTLANGKIVTENGKINVTVPDSITMNIGDAEDIPASSVISCTSSDSSIVEVADSKIVAKSKGVTYVTVISENDIYCAKISVLDSDASDDIPISTTPTSDTNSITTDNNLTSSNSNTTTTTTTSTTSNKSTTNDSTPVAVESPKTGDGNMALGFGIFMTGVMIATRKRKKLIETFLKM